jgi:hypothetical protein
MNTKPKPFRYQVNTYGDRDGVFTGNAVTFETADDAKAAAQDLFSRWTAVEFWRVLDAQDSVIFAGP